MFKRRLFREGRRIVGHDNYLPFSGHEKRRFAQLSMMRYPKGNGKTLRVAFDLPRSPPHTALPGEPQLLPVPGEDFIGHGGKISRRLIAVYPPQGCFKAEQQWRLLSGGTYEKVAGKGRRVRAQVKFYRAAVAAVRDAAHATPQFRPLTRPKPEE